MKNLKFTKKFCSLLLGGAITITSLSGCSLTTKNELKEAIIYDVVLDDLKEGDNQAALNYVNSLGFINESFRQSYYNYIANGRGNCFINARQENVVSIDVDNVDDLTDLRLFPNLRKVKISNSNITDFSPLFELTNLHSIEFDNMDVDCSTLGNLKTKVLYFNKVNISNTQCLNDISDITDLSISYSHFGNIDFIQNWDNLDSLTLINADINDLSILSNKDIEYLSINFCQVDDWSFLSSMAKLNYLDVSYSNFKDFSIISGLKKLKSLNLSYSLVDSVDGISNLKKLENLSIDSCQNLDNFDEVAKLKKLKYFNCTNLEMQTNYETIATIYKNCENVLESDYGVKEKVKELYESLNITDEMSDREKIQIVTAAVLDLVEYDPDPTDESTYYYNNHELKSALDGTGMCSSYTGITCALLDLAGIENYSIVGENFEDDEQYLHRWVVVKVDGEFVGLDTTFLNDIDASDIIKSGEDTEYYLDDLSDEVWQEYHYPYFMPDSQNNINVNFAR